MHPRVGPAESLHRLGLSLDASLMHTVVTVSRCTGGDALAVELEDTGGQDGLGDTMPWTHSPASDLHQLVFVKTTFSPH